MPSSMKRDLLIDGVRVADDAPCYVIGEMGHNHQGSAVKATALIEACAEAGVSAVKLQKRDNPRIYTQALLDAPYDNPHSYGATYGQHRAALEFDGDQFDVCVAAARRHSVTLFSTAFDQRSVDFLMERGAPALKIASGDLTNTPLIGFAARQGVPVLLSTGGGTLDDIYRAVDAASKHTHDLAVLHCTAAYPVHDFAELNLRAVETLRRAFPDYVIGWSGHDTGIAMSVLAYALGARIIEKHVTLNRAAKGSDHAFSLEPNGLRRLTRDLRRARLAMGDGVKKVYESEQAPLRKMQKSLVAARPLEVGTVLREDDLVAKSPGGGMPPFMRKELVGWPLTHALATDEPVTFAHLKSETHA